MAKYFFLQKYLVPLTEGLFIGIYGPSMTKTVPGSGTRLKNPSDKEEIY